MNLLKKIGIFARSEIEQRSEITGKQCDLIASLAASIIVIE